MKSKIAYAIIDVSYNTLACWDYRIPIFWNKKTAQESIPGKSSNYYKVIKVKIESSTLPTTARGKKRWKTLNYHRKL